MGAGLSVLAELGGIMKASPAILAGAGAVGAAIGATMPSARDPSGPCPRSRLLDHRFMSHPCCIAIGQGR